MLPFSQRGILPFSNSSISNSAYFSSSSIHLPLLSLQCWKTPGVCNRGFDFIPDAVAAASSKVASGKGRFIPVPPEVKPIAEAASRKFIMNVGGIVPDNGEGFNGLLVAPFWFSHICCCDCCC